MCQRACYAAAMQHSAGFLRLVQAARARIRECTVADVKRRLDADESFHLVDVREHEEWTNGHLPRARHLCKGIIERDIEAAIPDHDADIVLYCGGGFRSALAADNLRQMGYTRVVSMDGGWHGWIDAAHPITRG